MYRMWKRVFVATNLEFTNIVILHYVCQSIIEDSNTRAVQKDTELFFYLLLYLQLNQTCLLQSTPLYC